MCVVVGSSWWPTSTNCSANLDCPQIMYILWIIQMQLSPPPLCVSKSGMWNSSLLPDWKLKLDSPTVNNKLTRNIPHYLRKNLGDKIKSAEDGLPKKAAQFSMKFDGNNLVLVSRLTGHNFTYVIHIYENWLINLVKRHIPQVPPSIESMIA